MLLPNLFEVLLPQLVFLATRGIECRMVFWQ
jgi:hypothetical protein